MSNKPTDQNSQNKRRSRLKRDPKAKMRFEDRDLDILKTLFSCQLLTTSQIANLFFPSRASAVKRLRKLFDSQYVERIHRQVLIGSGSREEFYTLGKMGIQYLIEEEGLDKTAVYKSRRQAKAREDSAYPHIIGVNQIRIAFKVACSFREDYKMLFWQYDYALRDEKNRALYYIKKEQTVFKVTPDGFLGFERPAGKSYFFVEYQRGRVNPSRFRDKMQAYLEFWKDRQNGFRSRYPYAGFRVLVITEQKVDGFIKATRRMDSLLDMFYFTSDINIAPETLSDVPDAVFQPIWRTASDPELPTGLF